MSSNAPFIDTSTPAEQRKGALMTGKTSKSLENDTEFLSDAYRWDFSR